MREMAHQYETAVVGIATNPNKSVRLPRGSRSVTRTLYFIVAKVVTALSQVVHQVVDNGR